MKICVVGSGAIGGLVGGRMALAGEEVTLVDRGAHLEAIHRNGLKIIAPDGSETVVKNAKATGDLASAGPQDLVILALKSHHIASVAKNMNALFGPGSVLVPVQNCLPWWYFQRHGGPYEGRELKSCDPTGEIGANIDPERIIGCVVYPAAEVLETGWYSFFKNKIVDFLDRSSRKIAG